MKEFNVETAEREQMVDITALVSEHLSSCGQAEGICILFSQHTTCGLTVNENADPDVQSDMLGFLQRLIPQHEPNFQHAEQNSDAHIKSSIVGSSVTIPFENGKLSLGRWQGIYLCEFDGPRKRSVLMQIICPAQE
ncbi:MAG: secondary thiamine-phosphate synthase enzyme YjbQ [Pyrinomonadaceae bacterium]